MVVVVARLRISNEFWEPGAMFAKALRAQYPSAQYDSGDRPAEIAYWRARCQADGVNHRQIEATYEDERRRKARRKG
jgi:hypothetical protein